MGSILPARGDDAEHPVPGGETEAARALGAGGDDHFTGQAVFRQTTAETALRADDVLALLLSLGTRAGRLSALFIAAGGGAGKRRDSAGPLLTLPRGPVGGERLGKGRKRPLEHALPQGEGHAVIGHG